MNATSLQELRAAQQTSEPQDDRLGKVRELLVGETEGRLAALAARLDAVEASMSLELKQLSARIETLATSSDTDRRQTTLELARCVQELAARIEAMSKA